MEENVPTSGELAAAAEVGSPASPFSIPAIKGTSQRPTFDLNAWAVSNAGRESSEGSSYGGSAAGSGAGSEALPDARPGWQRAWRRLSSAGGAFLQAAAAAVSLQSSRNPPALSQRANSMEVLAVGREISAPYLPTKRTLSLQRLGRALSGTRRNAGWEEAAKQAVADRRTLAVQRWRRAYQAVKDAHTLLHCLEVLPNRLVRPEDRLYAAIQLRMRVQAYGPRPERLAAALVAQPGRGRLRWVDHVLNELFVTGETIFSFLTPPHMGCHFPYATLLLLFVLILVYFFMAGQYGQYQAVVAPATTACLTALRSNGTSPVWGPAGMTRWIAPRANQWCYGGGAGKFDAQFLIDWGARYAPLMGRSPQRWLTSTLLHQSFSHLAANCAMLAGFSWQMEAKHGSWRVVFIFLLAALGGNLFSAVTEAPCVAVVGASGILFGVAAATIADMIHNFETLTRPLLRTAILLAFLVFFSVTIGTTPSGTSHMSHVGGFVLGLLSALPLLRNPHRSTAELVLSIAGAVGCVALVVALPCVFYLHQLPGITC